MGADLYMIEPSADEVRKCARPAFDSAVTRRNALIAAIEIQTGKPPERKKGDSFEPEFIDPELNAAQAEVMRASAAMYPPEVYFRDSYNSTNVAWQLGFSWWQDIAPLLDDEGVLSPAECGRLADRFAHVEIRPLTPADLPGARFDENNTAEGWQRHFSEKRDRFIAFLRQGAASKGIRCSL